MNKFLLFIFGTYILASPSIVIAQTGLSRAVVTLNVNRDSILSFEEIQQAPSALKTLDTDDNGFIDRDEIGYRSANFRRRLAAGDVIDLVLSALDVDTNNIISATEIADSAWRLMALDSDNSGSLSNYELNSNPGSIGENGNRERADILNKTDQSSVLEPAQIPKQDGAATIADRETFKRLSYQGQEVLTDTGLIGLEFVKFFIIGAATQNPKTYFMNTETHRGHLAFSQNFNIGTKSTNNGGQQMLGVLTYHPFLNTPKEAAGLYTFEFEPSDIFDYKLIQMAYDQLIENAPILEGRLSYHPMPAAVSRYETQREQFEAAELAVFLDEDEYSDIAYLPLNEAEGFGTLRALEFGERPNLRDIVLYQNYPNEMPHVAGVITGFRQTPLSHVNLRAIQDGIPNAYISNATQNENITRLIDSYIYYKVAADGFEIREASLAEVEEHFSSLRPAEPQTPKRNLNNTQIRSLDEISFNDSDSVGVKASNVAILQSIDLPDGLIPQGFAIPFYYYDEFMKHNDFYELAEQMMIRPSFSSDADDREYRLSILRDSIKEGAIPDWMTNALTELQNSFEGGRSIRLRSSTNNEDMPSFSGAGLYDSFTHNPDEGNIAKSIKQVFASLWNFRAFEEREFFRVDHFTTAMGVLVHLNYSDEMANGVIVSDEVVYQLNGERPGRTYYANVQLGEDMVTTPNKDSIPEELLLNSVLASRDKLIRNSNRTNGATLLNDKHKAELRDYMTRIHHTFRELYNIRTDEQFAMEIEFKITADGALVIKQARPWIY